MSGHSKWHSIKHKKAKADKARAGEFTKLLKSITVAAQGGGDPEMNFALRLAVEKARKGNVPKDNIDRAIKKGSGEDKDGVRFEEAVYEGFGPGGVAMMIECLTDNKNRTVSEVKLVLSKNGGSAAGPGSVAWQFDQKGIVRISTEEKEDVKDWEEAQLRLMDAGVEEIEESEFGVELVGPKDSLAKMIEAVESLGVTPEDSGLEWIAKEKVDIDDADSKKLENLLDALDEDEDVKEVYTNLK